MNWARAYRRRNPVCGRCGNALAEAVHHIVPIATDPSRVFDETNVVGLCHPCHVHVHTKGEALAPPPPRDESQRCLLG
jgi:5-methylcytosine-specific restriction endonuclease McrA